MNKIFIFMLLLCTAISTAFADGVSVHLSQRKVSLNDSFSVTFSTAHGIRDSPDFTPLQTDFDIVSNSHENSITINNGQLLQEVRWNLVLIGKREGNLIIPSIRFGEHTSSPQAIEVTSATAVKQDDDIFMETELSPKDSVYEQALLTYTVRLYCSVKMAQATLSDISINDKDAIVERLGNDVEYDHHHNNGKHYRVYERKYTVFPQHAGELVFSPVVFEGAIITGGNSFFDVRSKIKRLSSEKQVITVKPIPAPFQKNNWLAANDVKLTEDWSVNTDKTILGEPITWTLKLTADGCLGDHIPDIAINFPSDLKHYFDKPEVSNQTTANGLIGIKQMKVALIATKPGRIELPKIAVSWWDLKANAVRHVELPAQTLNIQDNSIAMSPLLINAPTSASTLPQEEVMTHGNPSLPLWIWSILGLVILLAIGLFLIIYKKSRTKIDKPDSLRHLKNDLKRACQEGNAKDAETLLLAWFSQKFPQSKQFNLLTIKHSLNEELQTAIQGLYQALYSKNTDWNGEVLWKAFCEYQVYKKNDSKAKGGKPLLPELYS